MNTFERHFASIVAGSVDKTNVIGIRKALNHGVRIRRGLDGNRCNVTPEQSDDLLDAIYKHKPIVRGDLHASGVRVLINKRYAKRWTQPQQQIIDTLALITLVDFVCYDGYHHFPVYCAWSQSGASFDYVNVPWQSGGNGPEVVS